MAKDIFIEWDRSTPQPSANKDRDPITAERSKGPLHLLWRNGFIANRAELIRQNDLETDADDSQVLLAMFEQSPDESARRIAGPCSYVIWDNYRKVLTAARDRAGSCDIYYRVDGSTIRLSNRVKPILASTQEAPRPNLLSVAAHLTYQSPRPEASFYAGISSVPAGGRLVVTQARVAWDYYWTLEPQPELHLPSDTEYSDAYRELLFRVVSEYASSEAAGITLSSGLDSTSIAAALCACPGLDGKLKAFTWVAPHFPDADEELPAAAVCEHLGLRMERIRADLLWPLSSPEGIRACLDSPFVGYYNELWEQTLSVMRECEVGVYFAGMGGDHLFGGDVFGYPDLLLSGHWGALVGQLRAHLPHSRMKLPAILRKMVINPIAKSFVPRVGKLAELRGTNPWLKDSVKQFQRELPSRINGVPRLLPGRRQRFLLLQKALQYPTLSDRGRHFAAFDIESRVPLMDHRLVEFAASLPTAQTFQAAVRKTIVRRAMRGYLPSIVLDMRDKIYPTAIADWGLRHERDKVWPLMTRMRSAELGLVDEGGLRAYYKDFLEGQQKRALFWPAITLEDWLRRYF